MSNQFNVKKQLIDQSSHFFAAMIILLPLIAFPGVWTAAFAGFGLGLVREVTSRGTPTRWSNFKDSLTGGGSLFDLLFWTLGGAAVWCVFY